MLLIYHLVEERERYLFYVLFSPYIVALGIAAVSLFEINEEIAGILFVLVYSMTTVFYLVPLIMIYRRVESGMLEPNEATKQRLRPFSPFPPPYTGGPAPPYFGYGYYPPAPPPWYPGAPPVPPGYVPQDYRSSGGAGAPNPPRTPPDAQTTRRPPRYKRFLEGEEEEYGEEYDEEDTGEQSREEVQDEEEQEY